MDQQQGIRRFLPSKKFGVFLLIAVVIIGGGIATSQLLGTKSGYIKGQKKPAIEATGTVADIIERDSNKNDIPDWEEALWGLDPKGNGEENRKLINSMRAEHGLPIKGTARQTTETQTATDTLARELLMTLIALGQSGSLTPEAVTNLSLSLGKEVDLRTNTTTTYRASDMTIVSASAATKTTYKRQLEDALDYYINLGVGDELAVIAKYLDNPSSSTQEELRSLSALHKDMAKDIIDISTPITIAPDVLIIANTSVDISNALVKIADGFDDVVLGFVGIGEYFSASNALDDASAKLAEYFGT